MQYRVTIAGVEYGMSDIESAVITRPLFDKLSAGNACIGELELSIWQKSIIPSAAEIIPFCRTGATGDWTQLGVFYIDTRQMTEDRVQILAYDSMLRSEITWTPRSGFTYPAMDRQIAEDIAASMGVSLDPRCSFRGYRLNAYPDKEYSRRDALRDIAAAHAGTWIMTADDKLLLVPLFSAIPEETHYLVAETGRAITFGGVRILV